MADITMLADLSTFPVTRQELFDMWTTAQLSGITAADLANELSAINVGTDFSDAPEGTDLRPGTLFYHLADNLMFCWFDQIDDTGVSLWLAIGPDRFEVPCLAKEPIPAGAPVEIDYDKWCGLPTESHQVPLGYNQSGILNSIDVNVPVVRSGVTEFGGETTASGAWFRCAIDGIMMGIQLDPSSHDTQPLQDFSSSQPLAMDPDNPLHLQSADTWATPLTNVVGVCIPESSLGGGVATEPVYTFKFQFAPRVVIPFQ